jgi:hypothetical protein
VRVAGLLSYYSGKDSPPTYTPIQFSFFADHLKFYCNVVAKHPKEKRDSLREQADQSQQAADMLLSASAKVKREVQRRAESTKTPSSPNKTGSLARRKRRIPVGCSSSVSKRMFSDGAEKGGEEKK